MTHHVTSRGRFGEVLQAGVPKRSASVPGFTAAQGLLIRGVVVSTYVYDESGGNGARAGLQQGAIYCDVLVYSKMPKRQVGFLQSCLVATGKQGIHDGDIWRPRPSSVSFSGELDFNQFQSLADFDGDHVIVGFLDDDVKMPVILGQIPHPALPADSSIETGSETDLIGHRLRLKQADGDVRLWRHHGTYFGVRNDGSFVVDASRGYTNSVTDDGSYPSYANDPAPQTVLRLRPGGTFRIEIVSDPQQPVSSTKSLEIVATETEVQVRFDGSNNLQLAQSGSAATLTVGDGTQHVAIAEHLETLYNQLKARLDSFESQLLLHVHAPPAPPPAPPFSGPPVAPPTFTPLLPLAAPPWDGDIASSKVSIPDG